MCAGAKSFLSLFLARIGVGIGEAGLSPAAYSLISDYFPKERIGTAVAALQLIFPNQVRGQLAALFLFILNLGGMTMGPLLPGVFNDYLFHNEAMLGISLAITVGGASIMMLLVFLATLRIYGIHYKMMESTASS